MPELKSQTRRCAPKLDKLSLGTSGEGRSLRLEHVDEFPNRLRIGRMSHASRCMVLQPPDCPFETELDVASKNNYGPDLWSHIRGET